MYTTQTYRMNRTWNAILTIAGRDIMKFLRDPMRLVFALILPAVIGGVSGILQGNIAQGLSYSLVSFSIVGLLAMSLFQGPMSGLTSLMEDRESNFSQELFIAPISRYAIVFGKILGESIVALAQSIVLLVLAVLLLKIPISPLTLLLFIPVALLIALLGGSMGVLLISLFSNQRTANQIMPFLLMPQFFLAGAFLPLQGLPWYVDLLSRIVPMRYAVDLLRGIFYLGQPEYTQVVMMNPLMNLIIISILFIVMLVAGTWFFVRSERNQ